MSRNVEGLLLFLIATVLALLTAAIRPLPTPNYRPVGNMVISLPGAGPGLTTSVGGAMPVCFVCGARATWTSASPGDRIEGGGSFYCDLHKPKYNASKTFLESAGLYLVGYLVLCALVRRIVIGPF